MPAMEVLENYSRPKRRGRPDYQPCQADRDTVLNMARVGLGHEVIAKCIGESGIDEKTLRKHFRRELDTAAHMANATAGRMLFAAIEKGEAWAICFWMKVRMNWKETSRFEHTGKDGTPLLTLADIDRIVQGPHGDDR